MPELNIELTKLNSNAGLIEFDEQFDLLQSNRDRVRSLTSQLVSVISFLLPTSFLVLFFILQGPSPRLFTGVSTMVLVAVIFFISSLCVGIGSALLHAPSAAATKVALLDALMRIYRRERKLAIISAVLLFVGILIFALSLGWFAAVTLL